MFRVVVLFSIPLALGPIETLGRPELKHLQTTYVTVAALIAAGWLLSLVYRLIRYLGAGWQFVALWPLVLVVAGASAVTLYAHLDGSPGRPNPQLGDFFVWMLVLTQVVFIWLRLGKARPVNAP